MGTDEGSRDHASHRSRRYRDDHDDDHHGSSREHRDGHRQRQSREKDGEKSEERPRSRDANRRERKRSRSPKSPSRRRRSRSRDRERDHDHNREKRQDKDRESRSERGADREKRHRRHGSEDGQGKEVARRRRTRDDGDDNESSRDKTTKRESRTERPLRKDRSPLRRAGPLPSQSDTFAVSTGDLDEPPKPKEQPNFGNSGALAAASNSVQQADGTSITLKYHEPPEARKPPARDDWKLFVFKGSDVLDTVSLGLRSCWLVGREAAVVDLPAEHPSISKQHAVVQFRYVEKRNEFGDRLGKVKPYLIDLESANGTELNGKRVVESRYVELRDKDVVKFGHSTREYVVMLAPRD